MKQHKLFWGSSYDRGIQHLLKMWPTVKEKFPDATLDIAYGWDLFIAGYKDNPERMAWMERINKLMEQPGITHHGRLGKDKLASIRSQCGVWAYPTEFFEINCITGLEAQRDGLVPVTMALGALTETVQAGVKIEGDIYDDETYDAYLKALLDLMGDEKKWKEESEKAKKWAEKFSWDEISKKWCEYL